MADGHMTKSSHSYLDECLVVAAIDFGTACSGYAFSVRGYAGEIHINKNWGSGAGRTEMKTATCVLTKLEDDGTHTFLKFGTEAEESYATYLAGKDRNRMCLFNKFKMKLHNRGTGAESELAEQDETKEPLDDITDKRGTKTKSLTVFAMALRYIKDHLLDYLNKMGDDRTRNIGADYIRWVLTVPAIWTDKAKSFMRLAAVEAELIREINSDKLLFALEPEAASIYCKTLRMDHFIGYTEKKDFHMEPKTVYVVLDAGGGTVDITVHEVLQNGNVKELCAAKGGAWGATNIDAAFRTLLSKIWGADIMKRLQRECPSDSWEIERQFCRTKELAKPESDEQLAVFSIGAKTAGMYKIWTGRDIFDVKEKGVIINNHGEFILTPEKVDELFQETINEIVAGIRELKMEFPEIKYMFLVGGLSNSAYLTREIRANFQHSMTILIPDDPELAVLKGAVMFGENPSHISTRISRRTYGVETQVAFDPEHHNAAKKRMVEGKAKCINIFHTFLEKGEAVDFDTEIIESFLPERSDSVDVGFKLLAADKRDVKYADEEGIEELDYLSITPEKTSGKKRLVEFIIKFGCSEFEATAKDRSVPKGGEKTLKLNYVTDQRQEKTEHN